MKCSRRRAESSKFVTQLSDTLPKMLIEVGFSWNSKHTSFDGCVLEHPAHIEKPYTPTVMGSQN